MCQHHTMQMCLDGPRLHGHKPPDVHSSKTEPVYGLCAHCTWATLTFLCPPMPMTPRVNVGLRAGHPAIQAVPSTSLRSPCAGNIAKVPESGCSPIEAAGSNSCRKGRGILQCKPRPPCTPARDQSRQDVRQSLCHQSLAQSKMMTSATWALYLALSKAQGLPTRLAGRPASTRLTHKTGGATASCGVSSANGRAAPRESHAAEGRAGFEQTDAHANLDACLIVSWPQLNKQHMCHALHGSLCMQYRYMSVSLCRMRRDQRGSTKQRKQACANTWCTCFAMAYHAKGRPDRPEGY